jgi:small ligand-binding sensory domain FIST
MAGEENTMRFHSAISDLDDTTQAVDAVLRGVEGALGTSPDLLFLFFTTHHVSEARRVAERVLGTLTPGCFLGCSGEGVIGEGREIERSPGVAVLAGEMEGVRVRPFHIGGEEWGELLPDEEAFKERLGQGAETRALIGFGDPFTTPLRQFLAQLDDDMPGLPLIGGMASSGHRPGENVLILDDAIYDQGFVGLSLSGPIDVETVVSQGCRPVGQPLVITKARENVIEHLGGRPALAALRETIESLRDADKQLLQHGLFVGRAISEYQESWSYGDFLVRNVMGIKQDSGAIAVTDYVRPGQTIQFHVRDAETADEDLNLLLARQKGAEAAAGGLLFSCNGRGTRLFSAMSHDITAAREAMPTTPIAGFFAAGELGPVGGKNFVHGHTASFALFRARKN